MAKKYESPRGMDDILPGEIEKWQWLEEKARTFYSVLGYQEIRTPILESTDLFTRSIGETTDIVHKEMYTFEDRGGRSMTMRPEMTAAVARSVVQHGLLKTAPFLFLFYMGPMFRAERPQAGRKRQFHQIGAEVINLKGVDADFLIIKSLYDFLKSLKIQSVKLRINDLSLINGAESHEVREKLQNFFEAHKDKLDKDSVYRLDKNVLRIFDSKVPQTQEIAGKAPWDEIAPLSKEFSELCKRLDDEGVQYEVNRQLVRGLDYYTGTVFEVALDGLGAQDAVAGGGRYDRLYGELGGGNTPCTGFSIGMERLLMALEVNDPSIGAQMRASSVYFLPVVEERNSDIWKSCFKAASQLRAFGFRSVLGAESLKVGDQLKKANKRGAKYVVIKGQEEFQNKVWTLKNMDNKEEKKIQEDQLLAALIQETKESLTL